MRSLDRLAEASALLRSVEQSEELTATQRDACRHIRGLADALTSSIETLQEMDGDNSDTAIDDDLVTDGGCDGDETEHSDEFREVRVEADNGRIVDVEEYPGGDMSIYTSRSELYLTSDEASALRTALGRIDGQKRSLNPAIDREGGSS